MKRPLPVIEPHQFSARDLIGGDAALDFVNTVAGRDQTPRDWLDSYARLLEWAELARLLPQKNLRALVKRARSEPVPAASALARAKVFRESLFTLLSQIVSGDTPPKSELALLRAHWTAGVNAHDLRFSNGQLVAELYGDAADFDLIVWMIAYRLVEYVLPVPADRLRKCDGTNCSWFFIDSSKAGRRRWCDMAVCGNVAKTRRFYLKAHRQQRPHS